MSSAAQLVDSCHAAGITLISGVPCSSLNGLIIEAASHPGVRYVPAANEGDAVAIAAGAWLGGARGAVLLQNSGLGNAVNPLTSLIVPFEIPLVMFVGWRGHIDANDEPQHLLMGQICAPLLRMCEFQIQSIGDGDIPLNATAVLDRRRDLRLAYLVWGREFSKAKSKIGEKPRREFAPAVRDMRRSESRSSRLDHLKCVLAIVADDVAIVATTGKCSRELFELDDRPQHFYQVGSMGCASSIALGFSIVSSRRVVVLDGDGAALMRLGALATIGMEQPEKFIHIVLDNEVHDSTGGQSTAAAIVDLAGIAHACGYARIARCDDLRGFEEALVWAVSADTSIFIHAKIAACSSADSLGRPTILPADVAERFRSYFGSGH